MARRSDEVNAEPLEIVDRIVQRRDFDLAAVAGAGIHLADGQRTAERLDGSRPTFFEPSGGSSSGRRSPETLHELCSRLPSAFKSYSAVITRSLPVAQPPARIRWSSGPRPLGSASAHSPQKMHQPVVDRHLRGMPPESRTDIAPVGQASAAGRASRQWQSRSCGAPRKLAEICAGRLGVVDRHHTGVEGSS